MDVMPRSSSALGFTRQRAAARDSAPVVALGESESGLARWLAPLQPQFDITILHAPRRDGPRRFGVPAHGGCWYVGHDTSDPHGFMLSLLQLERFVLDIRSASELPIIVGAGQGAALALALASCWPERLRAVVAIDGSAPRLPAEALEPRPLAGLPVLLIAPSARARAAAEQLARQGAQTTCRTLDASDPLTLRAWIETLGSRGGR
jgi:pimeloyl-ACP methyl ester carboxylesterase